MIGEQDTRRNGEVVKEISDKKKKKVYKVVLTGGEL